MSKFLLLEIVEAGKETIDLVKLITVIAFALIIIALIIVSSLKKDKLNTRVIVNAAISISASFVLSFIKFKLPYGGSITFASFVPILIFSYAYGFSRGLLAGLVYGLLQFLQDSWFLTPIQLLLDYPLAFASIAFAGVFKSILKEKKSAVVLGVVCVGIARLSMHILAGFYFFEAGYLVAGIPASSAFVYSSLYNLSYVAPDILISIAVIIFMLYSGSFKTILNILKEK